MKNQSVKKLPVNFLVSSYNKIKNSFATMLNSRKNLDENVAFWTMDYKTGRILSGSKGSEIIYGIKLNEFLSKPFLWREVIHPDDLYLIDYIDQGLKSGKPASIDYRIFLPDGSIKWIHSWMVPAFNAKNELVTLEGMNTDITDKKIVEAKLKSHEARMDALIENSEYCIWAIDKNYTLINFNKKFEKLAGIFFGNIEVGQDVRPILQSMGDNFWLEIYSEALQGKKLMIEEMVKINGKNIYIEISCNPIIEQDETVGTTVFCLDITRRKFTEQALRESENKFRSLFNNAPIGLAIVELDGIYKEVNQAFIKITGYTETELLTMKFTDIKPPADVTEGLEAARDLTEGTIEVYKAEKKYVRKNGAFIWCSTNVTLIKSDEGHPLFFVVQMIDINDKKIAEDKLRESEQRFRQLSNLAFEGIAIHEKGFFIDGNKKLASIFGYDMSEICTMHALDIVAPESKELLVRKIQEQSDKPFEITGLKKDGSKFPLEITGKTITYNGREVRANCLRDITERKKQKMSF